MHVGPYTVDCTNSISVAVWDRQLKLPDGKEVTVYSATIQASYLEQNTGQWRNTPFFRGLIGDSGRKSCSCLTTGYWRPGMSPSSPSNERPVLLWQGQPLLERRGFC